MYQLHGESVNSNAQIRALFFTRIFKVSLLIVTLDMKFGEKNTDYYPVHFGMLSRKTQSDFIAKPLSNAVLKLCSTLIG